MLSISLRAVRTLVILFTLGCLAASCNVPKQKPTAPCTTPINNTLWPTLVANGKSDTINHYQLTATQSLLQQYQKHILQLDAELAYSCKNDSAIAKQLQNTQAYTNTYLGAWKGFLVFQISNISIGHRSVLLKGCDSLYRILYTEFAASYPKPYDSTIQLFPLPKLLPFQKTTILQIEQYIGGNQLPYATHFWTIDSTSNLPSYTNTIGKL